MSGGRLKSYSGIMDGMLVKWITLAEREQQEIIAFGYFYSVSLF